MKKTRDRRRAYRRGLWAEILAALYLFLKGFRILKIRYKTPVGEVDIIARKGDVLVFAEVKSRKLAEDGFYAVGSKSRLRIEKAAGHFAALHPAYNRYAKRFDVIVISRPFLLKHLDNAWRPAA